jgi:serralysin
VSRIDARPDLAGDQAFVLVTSFTGSQAALTPGQAVLAWDRSSNVSTLSLDVNGDGSADFLLRIWGDAGDGGYGLLL